MESLNSVLMCNVLLILITSRSSHQWDTLGKTVLKLFAKFQGERLCSQYVRAASKAQTLVILNFWQGLIQKNDLIVDGTA